MHWSYSFKQLSRLQHVPLPQRRYVIPAEAGPHHASGILEEPIYQHPVNLYGVPAFAGMTVPPVSDAPSFFS